MELLANYRQLRAKVEELCRRIEQEQAEHLVCRRGCAGCCRHLRLFPVEAAALAEALRALPQTERTVLRAQLVAAAAAPDDPCPLLRDGACLLYLARPIICRTHGLPLRVVGEAGTRIDFCPLNFTAAEALPATAVIDLERLNTMLAAINLLFLRESGESWPSSDARVAMADVLAAILVDND